MLNSEKGQKGGYTIVLLYKQIRQVTDIITPPPFVMNETMLKTMGHFQLLIHVQNSFLQFLIQKDIDALFVSSLGIYFILIFLFSR